MGRTQLQDAVPMTLGQEFNAFAVSLAEELRWPASALAMPAK
jgi:aspartate ammonia-lyase